MTFFQSLWSALFPAAGFPMGTADYFLNHGSLFLLAALFFPRLTLIFASTIFWAFGGIWAWLAWLFVPRLVIAFIATVLYGQTNPVLCAVAWITAIGAMVGGGSTTVKQSRGRRRR